MANLQPYIDDVIAATQAGDTSHVKQACSSLKEQLSLEPDPIKASDATKILDALRSARHFREMQSMAEAFLRDGCTDPKVERQLAQALIEDGMITPAIGVLEKLAGSLKPEHKEFAEALGLLGRSWKQRFVDADAKRTKLRKKALNSSIMHYRQGYQLDKQKNIWHGINMVAMLSMGDREKPNATWKRQARAAAKEILATISKTPEEKRDEWALATAAEAAVALGKLEDAGGWIKAYIENKGADKFSIGSTLRQLKEVWNLSLDGEGDVLIGPLEACLLKLGGNDMIVNPHQLQRMSEIPEDSYERVLGSIGPLTHSWMQRMFDRAASVALIRHNGRGIGTGFVIRGKLISDKYENEMLVLTNSHVVSEPPNEKSVSPEDATISFEMKKQQSGGTREYEIEEIVWSSPPSRHDVSILRLRPALTEDVIAPMPIAKSLPVLSQDPAQRVYIVGHPNGGEISYSLNDNDLIHYEKISDLQSPILKPIKIQYRAPTEPGSSGSPVFNANLRVIAIHHAGGKFMPRIDGESGTHPANEGLWIQALLNEARQV